MKSPEDYAQEICAALRELGRGSRQGHRPSAQADFGVYTADLRTVVRNYRKQLAKNDGAFLYELALTLIDKNYTECRQVAYELIAAHSAAPQTLNVSRIEALGNGLDNWCCVDNFCTAISGPAWLTGKLTEAAVVRWAKSKDPYWRRAAVVSTVSLNTKARGGSGDAGRTLKVCQLVVDDSEDTVQKALSWALRALVPWDRRAVQAFITEQGPRLPARVLREVRKKLTTGKKS